MFQSDENAIKRFKVSVGLCYVSLTINNVKKLFFLIAVVQGVNVRTNGCLSVLARVYPVSHPIPAETGSITPIDGWMVARLHG